MGLIYKCYYLKLVFQKQLHEFAITEPLVTFQGETEKREKVAALPKSPTAALNESLVECPKCNIQYPATEHRDLLVHVEYCSKQQNKYLFLYQKIQYCIFCQLVGIWNYIFHILHKTAYLPLTPWHASESCTFQAAVHCSWQ